MKHILLATVLVFLVSTLAMANVSYKVNLDTTPLQGVVGYVAFDFFQGFPIEDNTVTISAFTSNATLGALTPTGDAFGNISPGPGTLDDSNFFFNEFLQALTFGTSISFTIDLTTVGAPTADNFSLYLLDSKQFPFSTSDPTGADSLVSIDITGAGLTPNVYTSVDATATVTPVTSVTTPEPSSFWLLGIPLIGLIHRRGSVQSKRIT